MLPVAAIFSKLCIALQQHNIVLLSAPPGAGKSTYLPLQLLQHSDFSHKKIVMLEPRRLAVKTIAHYIASQLGESVGQTVGYKIRHDSKTSADTRLLIVTEGILTGMLQQDPTLENVDLLIFDEFHERSLHADLGLAFCLEVQQLRSDLKLLLMSATMDTDKLSQQLSAAVVQSEGRSYPVVINYVTPTNSAVALQSAAIAIKALQQHQGSILVFLPGQAEINQAAQHLSQHLAQHSAEQQSHQSTQQSLTTNVQVHALLGSMTLAQQQAAIAAPSTGQRKIVLATNLAQTSLTIEGITVVIDSGLYRRARFDPRQGITILETVPISQAAAIQRSGRAGRLSPGVCYRIDTAEKWQRRAAFDPAEIEIAELTQLRLDVASWGAQVSDLNWLTAPTKAAITVAEQLLQQLGLMDSNGRQTALGVSAGQLATDPRLAAMLLHAKQLEQQGQVGAAGLGCLLAALLEDSRVLSGDLYQQLTRIKSTLPQQWQQALALSRQLGCKITPMLPLELVPILLLRAFPDRLAKRRGHGYQLASGIGAALKDNDALQQQPWLVVIHLQLYAQRNIIYHAVSIALEQVLTDWHSELSWHTVTGWDDSKGRFYAEQQLNFGCCRLATKPQPLSLTAAEKQQAWLNYITNNGLDCLTWSDSAQQLMARQKLLLQFQAKQNWPAVSEQALLADLPLWLGPALSSINKRQQLADMPLYQYLMQRLDYGQQQQMAMLVPTHWQTPTGSKVLINYLAEGGPRISVRVQEMYGQTSSPTLLQGQLAITVELLSPGRQPLQLTQDLSSFWQNSWQEVRKEMRGRYPKHFWPEQPAQATPTTKTKKAMLR
ncbi:ATP-dependent helicase HrpB [Rheinheimera salexigens]|uniref:ATP-dependent helicase HrpB n=1 Tax=Rheinheimera salexigens TaxID=1628148 RepID=A0A1E7Q4P7_9GAMM|nr:ATP-dependent helicase HrpB [Rheinheimera salexigens]OEY69053.1 ATP-dependent helicase HrpB [Rheinheimera salexigens]